MVAGDHGGDHLRPTAPVIRSAVISADELYRYQLTRDWRADGTHRHPGHVLWVMLNPSTADGKLDDPTIRRCIGFTRRWGYGYLEVVNLYALRCTRPIHLEHYPDPFGPDNVHYWCEAADSAKLAVLAWGSHKQPRTARVNPILGVEKTLRTRRVPTVVLGVNQDGHPKHPLYVRADAEPQAWVIL